MTNQTQCIITRCECIKYLQNWM